MCPLEVYTICKEGCHRTTRGRGSAPGVGRVRRRIWKWAVSILSTDLRGPLGSGQYYPFLTVLPSGQPVCSKQSIQSAQRGVIGQLGGAGVCSLGRSGRGLKAGNFYSINRPCKVNIDVLMGAYYWLAGCTNMVIFLVELLQYQASTGRAFMYKAGTF